MFLLPVGEGDLGDFGDLGLRWFVFVGDTARGILDDMALGPGLTSGLECRFQSVSVGLDCGVLTMRSFVLGATILGMASVISAHGGC